MKRIFSMSFRVAAASSLLVCAVMGSPSEAKGRPILVNAPPPEELVTRHIDYSDLNLAGPAGERALAARIDSAVQSLCGDVTGARGQSFIFSLAETRCTRATWAQARPQMDLAVQRAHEIASTGKSAITAAAVTIAVAIGN